MSIKFMGGPGGWIHGVGGHAFFRARWDLGMKAVPRCGLADSITTCYMSTRRALQNAGARLYEISANIQGPMSHGNSLGRSPLYHQNEAAKMVQRLYFDRVRENSITSCIGRKNKARSDNKIMRREIYKAIFDHLHPKIFLYERLDEAYRHRWCKLYNLNDPRARVLSERAIRRLHWLSGYFPPRAHAANVRLHLNAWHTERRYRGKYPSRYSQCCFCNLRVVDSIEHFLWCTCLQRLFPPSWRGNKAKCFFLAGPAEEEILLGGMLVYGIYAFHCFARHANDTSEPLLAIIRLIMEVSWNAKAMSTWIEHTRHLYPTRPQYHQRRLGAHASHVQQARQT